MRDRTTFVEGAREVELLAHKLAELKSEPEASIDALIEAAEGDVLVLRRAHRHCRQAILDQWPATGTLVRAFFHLSAARDRLQPDPEV